MVLRSALVLVLFLGIVAAQGIPNFLPTGGIVTVGTINDSIAIMPSGGGQATCFGPNLGDDPNVVLWDPENPDDLLLGGDSFPTGYLTRMSFVSATSFTLTPIVPATGALLLQRPEQLSWSQTGQQVVVADSQINALIEIDPVTGAENLIVSGSAYWSGSVSAGAQHPLSGDYYVGTSLGEIWRVSNVAVSPQVTLFQSYAAQGAIKKILFDDQYSNLPGSPVFLVFSQASQVRRVDLSQGVVTTQTYASGVSGTINSLAIDDQGDLVYGINTQHGIYRIANQAADPMGNATTTIVGNVPCLGFPHRDLDVIGSTTRPFRLDLQALPFGSGVISIANYPQNADQGWLFFSRATNLPTGSGPFFGIIPDPLTLFILAQPAIDGGLLRFRNGMPPAGPLNPFIIPPFTMSSEAGQTWDGVSVVFDAGGQFLGRTNVSRVTWM